MPMLGVPSRSSRTNNSWLLFVPHKIIANNYLPLSGALGVQDKLGVFMKVKSNNVNWLLLIISMLVGSVGIFQLGYIIGAASFSSGFSFNQVDLSQIGLIGSGIWGVSEFARRLKKLKAVSKPT